MIRSSLLQKNTLQLNINRNREMTEEEVERAINELFSNTKICPDLCRAVLPFKVEAVVDSFKLVQNAYDKRICKHVNIQQLVFDKGTDDGIIENITKQVVDAVGSDYQIVTGMSKAEDGKCIATLITNPVAYTGGRHFYDNNTKYKRLLQDLSDRSIKMVVKDTVFFDNADLKKAYN